MAGRPDFEQRSFGDKLLHPVPIPFRLADDREVEAPGDLAEQIRRMRAALADHVRLHREASLGRRLVEPVGGGARALVGFPPQIVDEVAGNLADHRHREDRLVGEDGVAAEPFYQKRAPDNGPPWIDTATFTFPSGRNRRRDHACPPMPRSSRG